MSERVHVLMSKIMRMQKVGALRYATLANCQTLIINRISGGDRSGKRETLMTVFLS